MGVYSRSLERESFPRELLVIIDSTTVSGGLEWSVNLIFRGNKSLVSNALRILEIFFQLFTCCNAAHVID